MLDRNTFRRAVREHPSDTLPSGTPRASVRRQSAASSQMIPYDDDDDENEHHHLHHHHHGADVVLDVIAVTPQRGFSPFADHQQPHEAGQPFVASSSAQRSNSSRFRQQQLGSTGRGAYIPRLPWSGTYEEPLVEAREKRREQCTLEFNFTARRRQQAEKPKHRRAMARHREQKLEEDTSNLLGKVPILGLPIGDINDLRGDGRISANDAAKLILSHSARSCGGAASSGHRVTPPAEMQPSPPRAPRPPLSARKTAAAAADEAADEAVGDRLQKHHHVAHIFKPPTYAERLTLSQARTARKPCQNTHPVQQEEGKPRRRRTKPLSEEEEHRRAEKKLLLAAHQHDALKATCARSSARARENLGFIRQNQLRACMVELPPVLAIVEHERTVEKPRRVAELQKSRSEALQIVAGHKTDEVDAIIQQMVSSARDSRARRERDEREERERKAAEALQRRMQRQMAARAEAGDSPPESPPRDE